MDITKAGELLSQLVAIDSINPELVPSGAGESEIARFIANWLISAGLEVTLEAVAPGRPNVIAIARGKGGGHSLMLNAHIDTVGVAGMAAPFQPRIEGSRLYGRGAYDMKGSLAACMLAMAQICQMDLAGDVIFTGVVDEEYASIGTQAIVERWRADAAIVTEPTEMQLCIAHKGFVWLDIETIGRAAHGSRYDLGVDAIAKMGKILVELEALDMALRSGKTHPLLGTGSLHASLISGGQELSSYPERCILQIERRTLPVELLRDVETQFQAALNHVLEADSSFRAAVHTTLARDAFEIPADAPIVAAVREQARAITGQTPPDIGLSFWMDSAILSSAGIPTVIFGPGGEGAHAVVEWVDLSDVAQCAQIYVATAQAFCGTA